MGPGAPPVPKHLEIFFPKNIAASIKPRYHPRYDSARKTLDIVEGYIRVYTEGIIELHILGVSYRNYQGSTTDIIGGNISSL